MRSRCRVPKHGSRPRSRRASSEAWRDRIGAEQDAERLGVVVTMCGGRLPIRWRSPDGVSPVRTQVRIFTSGSPPARKASPIPASEISRLRWTSLDSA